MKLLKKNLLEIAIKTSVEAGMLIDEIYHSNNFEVKTKNDNSPITIADKKSNDLILKYLCRTHIPIISEETPLVDYEIRKHWEYVWIIDPLDGTKGFIKKNGEFTINIALIHKNKAVLGVIYIPVSKELYFADIEMGAYKYVVNQKNITLNDLMKRSKRLPMNQKKDDFVIVVSRSHIKQSTKEYIEKISRQYEKNRIVSKGSSLKFCLLAENSADIYIRLSPINEWDIAAGVAIVIASGGIANSLEGKSLYFNDRNMIKSSCIAKRI